MNAPRVLLPVRAVAALAAVLFLVFGSVSAFAQTFAGKIGTDAGERQSAFIDLGKVHRPFQVIGGTSPTPYDANGWPMSDGYSVLMDLRPIYAWAPPIDDPQALQPDVDGVYKLSFTGQADLALHAGSGPGLTLSNQAYDSATNTTTADVTLAEDNGNWQNAPALIVIDFTNTRRTPADPLNSGITNLRFIQPGYTAAQATSQIFTTEFIDAFLPFAFIRMMDWAETNYNAWHGGPGHEEIEWADRQLPSDASQSLGQDFRHGAQGRAWEYMITLCNLTNKDIWINIPVSATGSSATDTSSYVYKMALGFRYGFQANGEPYTSPQTNPVWPPLNSNLKIYLEHSNEVWNPSFKQYSFNRDRASTEVNAGGSNLNIPATTDPEVWARRRHARRTYECAKIFEAVFGAGSLNTKVLPIYCHRANYASQFDTTLSWMQSTFGTVTNYLYAMSGTNYTSDTAARVDGATVQDVLAAWQANSDSRAAWVRSMRTVANTYGLKLIAYEGGPDSGGSSTVNIGNRILANRDPAITALIEYHYRTNWFGLGGDMASYFKSFTAYSRGGSFGLSEDVKDLDTPKWQAIYNLIGAGLSPAANPTFSPPAGTYVGPQSVSISTATAGAGIRYTTDGSTPSDTAGVLYTAPVSVATTTTLKAVAYKSGMSNSAVVSAAYVISSAGTVADPTFNPPAGTYSSPQSVALSTTTSGASIRYTTDGSTPSETTGTLYSAPVALSAPTTLKAIAYKSGLTSSAVVSAAYDIGSPPVAPANLVATAGDQQVVLTWSAVSGATGYTVYVTTGGNFDVAGTSATTTFTHTGLTNGVHYTYYVTASNAYGESDPSGSVGATPVGSTTVAFTSVGAEDGYVIGVTTGQAMNATVATGGGLRTGDDATNRQSKTVVSFDTSSLPDNAVILSATLKIKRGVIAGTNPFTILGTCYVDIKGGTGFSGSPALELTDFEAPADAVQVATMSNAASNGAWSTGSLNASGLSVINKTGKTQLRVYFSTATNGNSATDYLGWYSGENSTAAYRPVLEITYQ